MSEQKVSLCDFDVSKMSAGQLKAGKGKDGTEGGMKKAPLHFNKRGFLGKTPKCWMPFGLSYSDKYGVKYNMDCSFDNDERRKENPKIQQFYNTMKKIDEGVINLGYLNRDTWFPGQFDEDDDEKTIKKMLRQKYSGIIKVSKDKKTKKPDGKHPDTLRIKAPHYDNVRYFTQADIDTQNFNLDYGEYVQEVLPNDKKTKGGVELIGVKIRKFNFEIYDSNGEPVDIESFAEAKQKGHAKYLLRFSIWVMQNGNWGLICMLNQAQVFIRQKVKGFAFGGEDSDPEEDAGEASTSPSPSTEDFITEKTKSTKSTKIEDSDEEEEDEEDGEDESEEESV